MHDFLLSTMGDNTQSIMVVGRRQKQALIAYSKNGVLMLLQKEASAISDILKTFSTCQYLVYGQIQ